MSLLKRQRVRGSIFCQKHEVEKELSYVQKFAYINNMNEYFRISNMRKNELEDYIFKLKQKQFRHYYLCTTKGSCYANNRVGMERSCRQIF